MIITRQGKDIISVTNEDFENNNVISKNKVHLIKILFSYPDEEKLDWLTESYPRTNRFVVSNNIKFFNWYFKTKTKKFYVENNGNSRLFSFFKKNNKILLNFNILDSTTKNFILQDHVFSDILQNLEIIQLNEEIFMEKTHILDKWNGNVIIS